MKKIIVSILAIAAAAVSANAQLYVGGSIDFSTNSSKSWYENSQGKAYNPTTSFTFSPEVGYTINEKMAAGARLSLSPSGNKNYYDYNDLATKYSQFNWSIVPYFRYKVCGFGNFGIWGQAYASFGTGTAKTVYENYSYFAPTRNEKQTNYGVGIVPVITYDINDHFGLVANLNLLRIEWAGYSHTRTFEQDNDIPYHTTGSHFSFVANGNTGLSIGVFYKF